MTAPKWSILVLFYSTLKLNYEERERESKYQNLPINSFYQQVYVLNNHWWSAD